MPTHIRLFKRSLLQQANILVSRPQQKPMYCTLTVPILHIPVSCANPVSNDKDIRPVAYILRYLCSTKQKLAVQLKKKPAYAVLKSIQRFDYYVRGAQCTLRCDHMPLEPLLTGSMKIAKLDRWVQCCFKSMISHLST